MSNYTKDKNIISINIDGVNGTYKFDIATGLFYGLRGQPVKSVTHKSATARIFYPYGNGAGRESQLAYTLYHMFDYTNNTAHFVSKTQALSVAEKLDNMKLNNQQLSDSGLEYIGRNFKDFVDYLKTRTDEDKERGYYSYTNFCDYLKWAIIRKRWGEAVINSFPENILARLCDYDAVKDYTAEEISICAYYLVRGKMYDYTDGDCRRLIEYISICKTMEKEPQKVNNFMREYCETKHEYELRKLEFDNARIRANYEKHKAAFEFEYGDFVVTLPTCGQDLIDEGRNMHHCVGGYVNHIIEGTDYIVFVRRKDNPEQCYITCEVLPDGNIRQYFLAYDRHIRNSADIEFKNAFQNHIRANWGE